MEGNVYEFKVKINNKLENILGVCISDTEQYINILGINEYGRIVDKVVAKKDIEYDESKVNPCNKELIDMFFKLYGDYKYNRGSTIRYGNTFKYDTLNEILNKLGFIPEKQFERHIINHTEFDSVRVMGDKLELTKTDIVKCDDTKEDRLKELDGKCSSRILNKENIVEETRLVLNSGFDDNDVYYVQNIYYNLDSPLTIDTAMKVCHDFK